MGYSADSTSGVGKPVPPSPVPSFKPTSAPSPTDSNSPAPLCPDALTFCVTKDNGEHVCCGARSDCDLENKRCRSSEDRCPEGTTECGNTCCLFTQGCDPESSSCQSRCKEKESECPLKDGTLGCCPANTKCRENENGETDCFTPPSESRCKAPQFACTIPGGDPHGPIAEGTACCNPGATCTHFMDNSGTLRSACCFPGFGSPDPNTGRCSPLGKECPDPKAPDQRCGAGEECCKDEMGYSCFPPGSCNSEPSDTPSPV